jgi:hypothetical protein
MSQPSVVLLCLNLQHFQSRQVSVLRSIAHGRSECVGVAPHLLLYPPQHLLEPICTGAAPASAILLAATTVRLLGVLVSDCLGELELLG